jgi:CubicO group peptidase (beta-lactamase class C family)
MFKKTLIFLLLLSGLCCKTHPTTQQSKPGLQSILADFEYTMQNFTRNEPPGSSISWAVVDKDRIIRSGSFGYADTSTIYRIGSISKCFTSFLMMQLVEKGRLKLDDPIESYLPEVKKLKGYNDSSKITFFQLATHTSGLEREPGLAGADQGPIADWEKKLLAAIPETSFESRPGTKFSYSNIGYAILGLALSRAAGKPFIDLIEENIFQPLQMHNSYFIVPQEKWTKLAKGRLGKMDFETPQREHLGRGYKVPNGGIYSTPNDLAKFIMAELGYSRLLNAKDLETTQAGKVRSSADVKYGLGLFIYPYDNKIMIHHAGSVAGYTAEMVFEKNSKYGVAIMCNYNTIDELLYSRAQYLLNQLGELPAPCRE